MSQASPVFVWADVFSFQSLASLVVPLQYLPLGFLPANEHAVADKQKHTCFLGCQLTSMILDL